MTRYLSFVLQSENQLKNRVDWYDEIKTPLLTTLILCDTGKEKLKERGEILHKFSIDQVHSFAG
jgi:acetone carboxylase gamma subunit